MTHPVTYQTDERLAGYDDEESPYMPTPEQIDAEKAILKAAGIVKAPSQPKKQYAERVTGRKHKRKK